MAKSKMVTTYDNLIFPVEKVKTADVTPFQVNPENEYSIVGTLPNGQRKLLYTCSDKYDIVPNDMIFPKLEDLFKKHKSTKEFTKRIVNVNDAIFYVYYTFTTLRNNVRSVGDVVEHGFWVGNSYNGKIPVRGGDWIKRLTCLNGLTALSKAVTINYKHINGEASNMLIDENEGSEHLFLIAMESVKEFETKLAQFEVLSQAKRQSDWEDRLEEVGKGFIPKYIDRAKEIVRKELSNPAIGGTADDWLIYNAINQVLMGNQFDPNGEQERGNKTPQMKMDADRKLFMALMEN